MNGTLVPHRLKNPRWCNQCIHPTTGVYRRARWIWQRPGQPSVYLCVEHAEDVRTMGD